MPLGIAPPAQSALPSDSRKQRWGQFERPFELPVYLDARRNPDLDTLELGAHSIQDAARH